MDGDKSVEESNSFFTEFRMSGSSVMPLKSSYENELKVDITTVSDDNNPGASNKKILSDDYSQRLANFMKNSNKLLESSKIKSEKSLTNNLLCDESRYLSESPLNALIELEDNLLHFEESNKVNKKYNFEVNEKPNRDDKPMFSDCDKVENANNENQKRNLNAKYNFQEALKIDDLENQIHNFQKQLSEKNVVIKDLQLKLRDFQNSKIIKNIIHHNKSTEFGDDFIKANVQNKDQNSNCSLDYEQFCNQFNLKEAIYYNGFDKTLVNNQYDVFKNSSIEDYDPNNPVVLKNKIKDLESQIEDLHEANEVASLIFSNAENVKIEKSYKLNEKFSEIIDKNKILQDEIKKLKENASLINEDLLTIHLQKELENVKQDLLFFKENNRKIFDENIKLKSIIENSDWFHNENKNCKNFKKREQSNTNEINEFIKQPLINLEQNMAKSIDSLNYNNYLCNQENVELSNDSTDSILSDVNKEIDSIKIKHVEVNNTVNGEIIPSHKNGYEYSISTNKEFWKRNSKILNCESKQFNKFSTLGRTAFAPRNGSDINIDDVVKFIRQGGRISKGLVHFIGRLPKRNDIYLGIELEIEEGKHDGIYEGIRYFHCREKKGVFVAFNKVIMVYSMNMER